jgi:hypothetical protein
MHPLEARCVPGYPGRDGIAQENNIGGPEQALAALDTSREGVAVDHGDPGVDVRYPLQVLPKGRSNHHDRDPRLIHVREPTAVILGLPQAAGSGRRECGGQSPVRVHSAGT